MTRDYVPAPKKTNTEVAIENAQAEKDQLGTSTRALAENAPAKKVGRKTVFTPKQVYKFHES